MRDAIVPSESAPSAAPLSAAIRANGFVFVSGQVGQDPATGRLVEGGFEQQAEQVFRNLEAVLDAAGKSFADVVRAGAYLTDMGNFPVLNAVYARHFEEPYPARTAIGVAALPLGAVVEIDLVVLD